MTIRNTSMYQWLFALGSAVLLGACGSSTTPNNQANNNALDANNTTVAQAQLPTCKGVRPPISGLDVPFTSHAVASAEETVITTATGTSIVIPANSFVDANGNPVTGEVEIKFREFHDAKDIIASGIIMKDTETGAYMETAGMFDLRGSQNGNPIFIKEDQNIEVNLASFNDGNSFNFYALDEEKGTWDEKGTANAKPNTVKLAALAKLDAALPKVPQLVGNQDQVENFVFDIAQDVDYKKFPQLKGFRNVMWEYAGQGPNPEKNAWVFETDWENMDLEQDPSGYFSLTLSTADKKFTTLVRPLLQGDDYEKALADFAGDKLEQYKKTKKQQAAERTRLAQQADLLRTFGVNDFGIKNWDVWHNKQRVRCTAKPQFDELADVNLDISQDMDYFLVTKNQRSVVRYDAHALNKFSFDPEEKNALIAVLPEGKVAVLSAQDFKKINTSNLNEKKKVVMEMATQSYQIKGLEDLDKAIDHAMAT